MKKATVITIVLISMVVPFLISCTQDATEGIYAQVVTQGASAKYRIKGYIKYDKDEKAHYFLEEGGVYKNSKCIIPGNFIYAADSYDNLYLLGSDGKISKYSFDGTSKSFENGDKVFGKLTPNGFALSKEKKVYKVSGNESLEEVSTDSLQDDKIIYILWSEDKVLVQMQKEGKINYDEIKTYLLNENTFTEISGLNKVQVLGFQKAGEKFYFLTLDSEDNYSYYYSDDNCSSVKEIKKTPSTPASNVNQTPSYYDNENSIVVFRCGSYYDKISVENNTATVGISGGFASNIHTNTMEVVRMYPLEDGDVIIAFNKYGLFKANAGKDTAAKEIDF